MLARLLTRLHPCLLALSLDGSGLALGVAVAVAWLWMDPARVVVPLVVPWRKRDFRCPLGECGFVVGTVGSSWAGLGCDVAFHGFLASYILHR